MSQVSNASVPIEPRDWPAKWCVGILSVVCLVLFLGNSRIPLMEPDETRCAAIVQNMLRSGDWIMPRLEGEAYFDKPAPFFWLAAAGQKLTGSIEMGGRCVSAVAALGCVLLTFWFARRLGGNRAGTLAGLILATGSEFVFIARWYRMDMSFGFLMWAALCWFWWCESAEPSPAEPATATGNQVSRPGGSRRRIQWIGFYALSGLATLMKGPAGLVLTIMVVAGYLVLSGQWRRLTQFFSPLGIIVYLAIAAPWYIAASIYYPSYLHEFLINQNMARYADSGYNRHTLYSVGYLGILMGSMMPWAIYLPGTLSRTFPFRRKTVNCQLPVANCESAGEAKTKWAMGNRQSAIFLWVASFLPLVFFMASRTQLPNYILPVFPPLSVLVALPLLAWARSNADDRLYHHGAVGARIALLALALTIAGFEFAMGSINLWIALPIGTAVSAVALGSVALRRPRLAEARGWFLACLSGGTVCLLLFLVLHSLPVLHDRLNFRELGLFAKEAAAAHGLGEEPSLCSWGATEHSVAMYADVDRMERFSSKDAAAFDELVKFMLTRPNAFCVIRDPGVIQDIQQRSGRTVVTVLKKGPCYLVKFADLTDRPQSQPK